MSSEKEEEKDITIPALALTLMQHNNDQTTHILNELMEGYKRDYERECLRLRLITERITYLCNQPWSPNPIEILEALHPDERVIEKALGE